MVNNIYSEIDTFFIPYLWESSTEVLGACTDWADLIKI